ncbi:macrophage migration inhibitory factor homolog isoform X1 [Tanacetum coccineum]
MAFLIRQYVMIVLKGSIPIAFGGTEEPAAYGELVSIGGLNANVNKKLSAAVAEILETKLSVPKSRFFLKFYDTKASYSQHLDILERMCHNLFSFPVRSLDGMAPPSKLHYCVLQLKLHRQELHP